MSEVHYNIPNLRDACTVRADAMDISRSDQVEHLDRMLAGGRDEEFPIHLPHVAAKVTDLTSPKAELFQFSAVVGM